MSSWVILRMYDHKIYALNNSLSGIWHDFEELELSIDHIIGISKTQG